MGVELLHPQALLILLVVPYLWLVLRRSLSDFPRWQRRTMVLVRSLVVILAALALSRPQTVAPVRRVAVVAMIDHSPSMDAWQQREADRLGARTAAAGARARPVLTRPFGALADETDLAAAIRLGAALLPAGADGRVLLVSDGNQTHGDAVAAAAEARAAGLRVFTATVPPADRREVLVRSVTAPPSAAPRETIDLTVSVESTHDQRAVITVNRGAFRVARRAVDLRRGTTVIRLATESAETGPAVFTVTCDAPIDTAPDNNTARAVTMVRGPGRVLLVESAEGEQRWLERVLRAEAIDVRTRPPLGVPRTLTDLNAFDLVILADVPATALTASQMTLLGAYVRDLGGGLIMVGGENSFGPGGYYKTPVAALLPVRLETRRREELPGIALVLVIDKSGSMNADQKIDLAKDAAVAASEVLAPSDQVAVVTFDAAAHLLLPLQPARNRTAITGTIARLRAGGGTSIDPALREAHRILKSARAKLKHVILLSDGRSSPGDFEGLMAAMTADRITVSTVAIGGGADTDLLRTLAQVGGGRAYVTNDPFNIPQIFTKETITAARRSFVEEPFQPRVVRRSPVIRGLDFETAPMLLAYVVTKPRAGAETILASERGDPILARWSYGLGTVTAFTSDARNRWAAEWLDAPIFPRFWTQLVRDALRREAAGRFPLTASVRDDRARITLDALDLNDEFLNNLAVAARIVGPDGQAETAALSQTAPGRYEAEIDARRPGAYAVQIMMGLDPDRRPGPATAFVRPEPGEMRTVAADASLMWRVAEAGGGAVVDEGRLDAVFEAAGDAPTRHRDAWPIPAAAALILFLADVFLRRIRLPGSDRRAAV